MKKLMTMVLVLLIAMPFIFADNPFDQDLNKSSDVTFNKVKVTEGIIAETFMLPHNYITYDFGTINKPAYAFIEYVNHGDGDLFMNYANSGGKFFFTLDELFVNDVIRTSGIVVGKQGILYQDMNARPPCTSSLRGQTWFTERGTFYADQLCLCKKDRLGNYNWVNIAREDNLTGYLC